MKKVIMLLLVAVILTGCAAKGRPKDMRQEVYDEASAVYDAVKAFLDGSGSASGLPDLIDEHIGNIQSLDTTGWDVSEQIKEIDVCNALVKMNLTAIDLKLDSTIGNNVDAHRKELTKNLKELKKILNK